MGTFFCFFQSVGKIYRSVTFKLKLRAIIKLVGVDNGSALEPAKLIVFTGEI